MKKEDNLEWTLWELHEGVSRASGVLILLIVTLFCAFFILLLDLGEETARKSVMWLLGAAAVGALPCFIRMVALAKRIGKVRRPIADKVSRMDSDASDGQDPEEVFYLGDDFSLGRIEESDL